jgi:hypothetical protein
MENRNNHKCNYKGPKCECENYRGITLFPTAYKLFSNIIKQIKCPFERRNTRGTV